MSRKQPRQASLPEKVARTAGRLAVQFSREAAGEYETARTLGEHAAALVVASFKARSALERGSDPRKHYAAAQAIADRYHADVVPRGELLGMVVGIKFRSGNYRAGLENVFYIA